MGRAKADLEWHGSTLLGRTVRAVARAVDGPVVVVRAAGQQLPPLPPGVEVLQDEQVGLGPLHAMAVGLAAVRADRAYVTATDSPFLHPAFVRRVLSVEDVDVALPVARGFKQPLAAAYATSLAPLIGSLVADGLLKPAFLFERCQVARLDEAALLADPALAAADPSLESLVNVNEPADYQAALAHPAPLVTVHPGATPVRAWTIAEAAAALSLTSYAATLDNRPAPDPLTPLAPGDILHFG
jgi:molybdopterin-guanine dinucleotide biosynthesis protein A